MFTGFETRPTNTEIIGQSFKKNVPLSSQYPKGKLTCVTMWQIAEPVIRYYWF